MKTRDSASTPTVVKLRTDTINAVSTVTWLAAVPPIHTVYVGTDSLASSRRLAYAEVEQIPPVGRFPICVEARP